jgi:integrase
MSLKKRGEGGIYHYEFQYRGRRYQGTTGTKDKKVAGKVEAEAKREAKALASAEPPATPAAVPTIGELSEIVRNEKRITRSGEDFFTNLTYLARTIGLGRRIDEIDNPSVIRLIVCERIKGLLVGRMRTSHPGPVEPMIPTELLPEDPAVPLSVDQLSSILALLADEWEDAPQPRRPLGIASVSHGIIRPIRMMRKVALRTGIKLPDLPALNWRSYGTYDRSRVMGASEEYELRQVADPERMLLYDFAMQSMLRRANIIGLKWSDVDLANRQIHVRIKSKGGGKKGFYRYINDVMLIIIKSQIGRHPEYVFSRPIPGSPRRTSLTKVVGNWFREDCAAAGIKDLRFHDLRRTGATRMYAAVRGAHARRPRAGGAVAGGRRPRGDGRGLGEPPRGRGRAGRRRLVGGDALAQLGHRDRVGAGAAAQPPDRPGRRHRRDRVGAGGCGDFVGTL